MSKTVPLYGFGDGSGGASLNFKMIGGTAEPSTPVENTIWINTDHTISGYILSVTQPEAPEEGTVWISTGTSSPIAFSVTKKNPVMVYPISAKQYVSDAWIDVTAKSYQNGEWVDWVSFIVRDGVAQSCGFSTDARTGLTIVQMDGFIQVQPTYNKGSALLTDTKLDLTNISKLTLDFELMELPMAGNYEVYTSAALIVIPGSSYSDGNTLANAVVAFQSHNATGRTKIDLNVSNLSGEYYVGVSIGASGATPIVKIYNLWYQQ